MNNAASLYWCRSSKKDLDRLRFYYGMGLSAVAGQNAMTTLGMSSCKQMSVSEDNLRMNDLRKLVGVKSIKEIAMTDAVATIKQVEKFRPAWFVRGTGRRTRTAVESYGVHFDLSAKYVVNKHKKLVDIDFPTEISESISESDALIGDIWRLACEKIISDDENKVIHEHIYKHKFEEFFILFEYFVRKKYKIRAPTKTC